MIVFRWRNKDFIIIIELSFLFITIADCKWIPKGVLIRLVFLSILAGRSLTSVHFVKLI